MVHITYPSHRKSGNRQTYRANVLGATRTRPRVLPDMAKVNSPTPKCAPVNPIERSASPSARLHGVKFRLPP